MEAGHSTLPAKHNMTGWQSGNTDAPNTQDIIDNAGILHEIVTTQ